jgi:hypothetical protein
MKLYEEPHFTFRFAADRLILPAPGESIGSGPKLTRLAGRKRLAHWHEENDDEQHEGSSAGGESP